RSVRSTRRARSRAGKVACATSVTTSGPSAKSPIRTMQLSASEAFRPRTISTPLGRVRRCTWRRRHDVREVFVLREERCGLARIGSRALLVVRVTTCLDSLTTPPQRSRTVAAQDVVRADATLLAVSERDTSIWYDGAMRDRRE